MADPKPSPKREGQTKHIEREFETMSDELFKLLSGVTGANVKRTYDEYQETGLAGIRSAQAHAQEVLAISRGHLARVQSYAELGLAKAIENADALMKQHLAHRDIATDCTWDPGPGEESLQEDED
jgi:hypothetical protein